MTAVLEPRNVHPIRWRQAMAVSRETCAHFLRDGRSPADAVRAFGLMPTANWASAINAIAELHCAPRVGRQVA